MSKLLLFLFIINIYLIKSSDVVTIEGSTAKLATNVIYAIKSVSSGKYLNGRNADLDNPLITGHDPNGQYGAYVSWEIVKTNKGYAIRSVSSGKYLNGRTVIHDNPLITNHDPNGQYESYLRWTFEATTGKVNDAYPHIAIRSASSGLRLNGRGAIHDNPLISNHDPNGQYGVYMQWIFIPVGYTLNAAVSNFDFGDYGTIQSILESEKQVAFIDKDVIVVENGAVGLTKSGNYGKSIEESFSFGFTETIGIGIETEFTAGVPLIGSSTVTVSASFEFSANQQHTETKTSSYEESYSFTPQTPGIYEVGMEVYEDTNVVLPFSSEALIVGKDIDDDRLTGQELQGIIYYGGFDCEITKINAYSIEAKIEGTLTGSYAVYSVTWAKKTGDIPEDQV